jgi:glycosyltransferase involved in cell wall biosynthesis
MTGFHPFVLSTWGSDLLIELQKSSFRRLLVRLVLSSTDYLTVPSKFMYNAAQKLGFNERNLCLIPWGVETDIFKPIRGNRIDFRQKYNIPPNAPVILSPRAIQPIYNQDIVIKSCQAIKSQYPELKLLLLKYNVSSNYFMQLESLIVSCGMENNVIWLPAQDSQENMAILYQLSDVVLSIPSSEGYGFSVYEAISTGIPTVITDLPVFQEDLQDEIHVLKVPPQNVEATADAVKKILSNLQLRHILAENCIFISSGFGIQARIDRVEDLYRLIKAQNL